VPHRTNPDANTTVFYFSVNYNPAQASQPCGSMSIETLFVQTNSMSQDLGSFISSVTFAGVEAPYAFGPGTAGGPAGLQVSLSGFGSVEPSTPLVITLSGTFTLADMCDVPWYGAMACPYVLAGPEGSSCCPSGAIVAV
jgi:hypothetical protein